MRVGIPSSMLPRKGAGIADMSHPGVTGRAIRNVADDLYAIIAGGRSIALTGKARHVDSGQARALIGYFDCGKFCRLYCLKCSNTGISVATGLLSISLINAE